MEGRSRSIGVSEGPAKSNRNKVDTSCAGSESLRSSTAKSVIGSRSPPPHNVKCSMYLYLCICIYRYVCIQDMRRGYAHHTSDCRNHSSFIIWPADLL